MPAGAKEARLCEGDSVRMRAILGEAIVEGDGAEAVAQATRRLIEETLAVRGIERQAVVSALFTLTADIASAFPAATARAMGWTDVPLLCVAAVPVPGAPERCIRVLLHVVVDE